MADKNKYEAMVEEPTDAELKKIESEDSGIEEFDENFKGEDSVKAYFREIIRIPLLSAEEEKQCGEDLKKVRDLKAVKRIKDRPCFVLNLSHIFVSLENCSNKDLVIDTLIDFYRDDKKGVNKIILDSLTKYKLLCKKLGRTPSVEELNNEFIMTERNPYLEPFKKFSKIDELELLNEINTFLKYSMSYEKMVSSNLRLVVNMSKSYANKFQMPILDLISEGNIGLMKAVDKYDIEKGFRFSTYASWWIRQSVSRYVYANASTFNVPEYIAKDAQKIRREVAEMEAKEGRKITISELSQKYGMQESTMLACLTTAVEEPVSISLPIGEEEDSTLEDFIADETSGVEDVVFQNSLSEDIRFLFDGLTPRELGVIKLRFGIGTVDGYTYTLEEVGKKYNVTRERIRQIEARALKKMRTKATKTQMGKALKSYLN